jgi:hypothetical protein
MIEIAHKIGFFNSEVSAAHRGQIVDMMQLVFKTLVANQPFEFSDQTVAKQLQTMGFTLIEDGFIPPPLPIEVLLLHRKIAGVFLLCARLSASVDVADLLQQYVIEKSDSEHSKAIA